MIEGIERRNQCYDKNPRDIVIHQLAHPKRLAVYSFAPQRKIRALDWLDRTNLSLSTARKPRNPPVKCISSRTVIVPRRRFVIGMGVLPGCSVIATVIPNKRCLANPPTSVYDYVLRYPELMRHPPRTRISLSRGCSGANLCPLPSCC